MKKVVATSLALCILLMFAGCDSNVQTSDLHSSGNLSGDGSEIDEDIGKGECNGMVRIKAGSFRMGSTAGENNNRPVHSVTLTKDFYMCDHEVTQIEYKDMIGKNPSKNTTLSYEDEDKELRPVDSVSWYDALVYCNKRSIKENLEPCYIIEVDGQNETDPDKWGNVPSSNDDNWNKVKCNFDVDGYRLPTEAEWEYAARAGNDDVDNFIWSGTGDESKAKYYLWYYDNSHRRGGNAQARSHEVERRKKNAFNLYDMSGNVNEWCWDRFDSGNSNYSSANVTNPTGITSGEYRIYRGGSYCDMNIEECSVIRRHMGYPSDRSESLRFRVCRTCK